MTVEWRVDKYCYNDGRSNSGKIVRFSTRNIR